MIPIIKKKGWPQLYLGKKEKKTKKCTKIDSSYIPELCDNIVFTLFFNVSVFYDEYVLTL